MGYYFGKNISGGSGTTMTLKDAVARVLGDSTAPAGVGGTEEKVGAPGMATRPGQGGRQRGYRDPETGRRENPWARETPPAPQLSVDEIGEWQWPPEMKELYDMLWGQTSGMLKNPGFSQEAIDAMFGRNFENIRGAERGTRETIQNELAAQGMLNTGTALDALTKTAWETEKNVGKAKEDVFLADEAQKRQDLTQAQQFFNTLGEFNQIQEALNAVRRNEANQALAMMLQFYGLGKGV